MASVDEFLIERLENAGLKHIFGVCGDYILPFFSKLTKSKKITLINNTDEAGAGFAADAYGRANGVACVCVTYNVGALKLFNPVACAFAEKSPVIVISGAPGVSERSGIPLHHMVGPFDCQREMFKRITCAQAFLDNSTTAGYEIDKAFETLKYKKQPIYIELPRDIAMQSIHYDVYTLGTPKTPVSDLSNLEDGLKEVAKMIEDSKNPIILAGVEIARYKLGRELTKFAEKHNIPMVTTLLSKSVINEMHPLYLGVYAGSNSSKNHVKEMVENSDCLIVCGEVLTEATVGYRPSKVFEKRDMITCTIDHFKVKNHHYPNVLFGDFFKALFHTELTQKKNPALPEKSIIGKFIPVKDCVLTIVRFFEKINSIINEDTVIVADVGDSLIGASDLTVHHHASFYGPAFYLSMGYAIPASLGIKLAKPLVRPVVLVGDGAFQMSCTELSTILKYKLNPIIFVLNNKGYTTERMIVDGRFNDIVNWNYHLMTELLGGGKGFKVGTEEELENAVREALKSEVLTIINCDIDAFDISPALKRISESLSKKVKNKGE
jgi:indolepyruvate decarboxylase